MEIAMLIIAILALIVSSITFYFVYKNRKTGDVTLGEQEVKRLEILLTNL